MSYSEEIMDRHRRRKAPLVGAGPYCKGQAIHFGWDPPKQCPTLVRFVDEVPLNSGAPSTKLWNAAAITVQAGFYIDYTGGRTKYEAIFVLPSGVSNVDGLLLPWDAEGGNWLGMDTCSASLYINMITSPDIIDPTKPMYYKDATWNTHNYNYGGAAGQGSVLYADAANWEGYKRFLAPWIFSGTSAFGGAGGMANSPPDLSFAGAYDVATFAGPIYGIHVYVADAFVSTSDVTISPDPPVLFGNVGATRTFKSSKIIAPTYRQRGYCITSDFAP